MTQTADRRPRHTQHIEGHRLRHTGHNESRRLWRTGHNEKGSATLHSLFAAVLLITALAAATLWSAISTARHQLTAAADLTALSAAQSLTKPPTTAQPSAARQPLIPPTTPETPCTTAARIATLHKAHLTACHPTPTEVTVGLSLQLNLPFTHPTLTTTARAGPL
ncbi:flp pilus-assembly TadE/G-like family protein [Kribbella sp. NPDC051952]|uniref:flp pilus-assembly TadE/G-like family protein n=1 Tax=Kribbella sp. NPDC051952 TaxID=3154851 RepID=UPI00344825D9